MKKYIIKKTYLLKLLLVSFLVGGISQSCTDLDEELFSEVTADNFFQTDEEFISALGDAYTSLYGFGNHNSYWSFQTVSSDKAIIPQRGPDWFDGGIWLRVHMHEPTPDETVANNAWNFLFGGINSANRLIFQFETLLEEGNVDPEATAGVIFELKALRALYYYWGLDLFGNIPIVQDFEGADPNPPTRSRADVYAFVEAELLASVNVLPEAVDQSTYARMNRWVVEALLSKLYLNAEVYTGTQQWQKAADRAANVINSGKYNLEGDFFFNFSANNSGSRENILTIPYDQVFAAGFNLPQMTLHYGSQATFNLQQQPWNGYASLKEYYESFEDDDVRKQQFIIGPQFASDGSPILDSGSEPNDPDGPQVIFTPEINEISPGALRQAGVRLGKWEFELGATPDLNNDYSLLRLGDIILVRAEALWRMDPGSGEALILVNQIRDRAGVDDFATLTAENLLAERGREVAWEGWDRQDLIRFAGINGGVTRFNDPWEFKPISLPEKNIMPIPRSQIDANANLIQNPSY